MSVINRMLTDLERRGGHTAVGAPDLQPAERPRRRRLPTTRLATIGLAVALVAVASVLWLQRGPAVADQIRIAFKGPGDDGPVEVAAYQPDTEPEVGAKGADGLADGATDGAEETSQDAAAAADTTVAVTEPQSVEDGQAGADRTGDATTAAEAGTDSETAASAGTASAASASDAPRSETPGTASPATNGEAPASEPGAEPAPVQVAEAQSGSVRSDDRASDEVLARRRYSDARDALAAGEMRRARRLLEQAVDLDPDLHSAREVLVTLLRRAGDNTAAREQLAAGLEQAPARSSFAKPYARMRVDDGAYAHARDVLEAARINAEGELDFHALLANVHRRLGDHRAAITEYTDALEIDSSQASLWLGLGISLAADGHGSQAQAAFREARETGQLSESLDHWAEQKIEDLARSEGGA